MTIKWVKVDPLVLSGEPFCYNSRLTVRQLLELRRAGYDVTRNIPGGSEWNDLDQSTTAILDQSTTAILDNLQTVVFMRRTIIATRSVPVLPGGPAYGRTTSWVRRSLAR